MRAEFSGLRGEMNARFGGSREEIQGKDVMSEGFELLASIVSVRGE
jgi:hypothetical protein